MEKTITVNGMRVTVEVTDVTSVEFDILSIERVAKGCCMFDYLNLTEEAVELALRESLEADAAGDAEDRAYDDYIDSMFMVSLA